MAMHEVKVLVPEERLADFYARFGAWLAGSGAAFDEEDTLEKGKSTAKSWGARVDSAASRSARAGSEAGRLAGSEAGRFAGPSTGSSESSRAKNSTGPGADNGADSGSESRTDSRTGTQPAVFAKEEGTRVRAKNDSGPGGHSPQDRFAEKNADRGMRAAKQASDRVGLQDDDLLDGAIEWWRSLKRNERDIFTLFMDAAPQTLGAAEIVAKLGLKSERVIPGVLAWPRRKAARAGFPLAWKFEHDPDGKALYGLRNMPEVSMSATEYAALMREAKRTVEG